jgi:hypothetical protein
MVTRSRDRARIWDVESGREVAVLKHPRPVLSAALSGDGKQVVTASFPTTAHIWDVDTGKEIAVLYHPNTVDSAAFSADGKQVVTASSKTAIIWRASSKTARVWDRPGEDIAVLKGHTESVLSAAFSADGKRVVTASNDKTARIWDAESGKETAVLKGHTGPVQYAAFSTDGTRVVTTSEDGTARIWDVTWATLVRGDDLRERVCGEKLIGGAQEFTDSEIGDDPILRGIDKDDPIARNPCLRRGPLSLDYWTRLPGQLWRSTRKLVGVD